MTVDPSDLCDMTYISRATGISGSTLRVWASRDRLITPVELPRIGWGALYRWSEVRPVLAARVKNPSIPVEDWPA